ncbi:MAG: c-type cytochrome, partial [Verrucomicrobiota bacterium]|nr:c-type cytochrome [Verrucomicrobiota bacterium]
PKQVVAGTSAGDTPGEEQPPPSGYPIPPAPALSPEEALKTFRLPPGYRLEIVASEPLVNTPVALDFDPEGRIWVVEMRGYQRDPEGSNRLEPVGRIVVLEDTNRDRRMDRSTVYMDGLVLPRAVRVLIDGVLVAEPPYVWYTRDTDGDLRMDEKSVVVEDYGVRESNPGHAPNGLLLAMDNWLHSSNYSARLRRVNDAWIREPVPVLGHWGIGMDDFGRTYMNTNSAPLRANFVASSYRLRNPDHEGSDGVFEPITASTEGEVFPIRPNPGVNRGYIKKTLRHDGRLMRYTAGCGQSIFRGDRLPAEVKGNHFFCEPAGNLVRRTILTEREDGTISGVNAHPKAEFLASTDERFRPVNTATARTALCMSWICIAACWRRILSSPVISSGRFMSSGSTSRWIAVASIASSMSRSRLARRRGSRRQAVPSWWRRSAHPNGWWRDTAQRLLVERKDLAVVPALRGLARSDGPEVPRLHALWALEGLAALTGGDLAAAHRDPSPRLRAAAVRLSEPWLRSGKEGALTRLPVQAAGDPAATVRLQAAASLGELKGAPAIAGLAALLTRHGAQPFLLGAVISSLHGRELEMLRRLGETPAWNEEKPEFRRAVTALAATIFRRGKVPEIEALLGWSAARDRAAWQQLAVLRSVTKPMLVARKITIPPELTAAPDKALRTAAATLGEWLQVDDGAGSRPLDEAEQLWFGKGAKAYAVYCAQCHQADGRGLPGLGQPLAGSKWVLGAPVNLAKIVLHGKQDKGLLMPPWGNVLNDDHLASILTYIRRSWGNTATPVHPELVRKARAESASVHTLWTEESLLKAAEEADKR